MFIMQKVLILLAVLGAVLGDGRYSLRDHIPHQHNYESHHSHRSLSGDDEVENGHIPVIIETSGNADNAEEDSDEPQIQQQVRPIQPMEPKKQPNYQYPDDADSDSKRAKVCILTPVKKYCIGEEYRTGAFLPILVPPPPPR